MPRYFGTVSVRVDVAIDEEKAVKADNVKQLADALNVGFAALLGKAIAGELYVRTESTSSFYGAIGSAPVSEYEYVKYDVLTGGDKQWPLELLDVTLNTEDIEAKTITYTVAIPVTYTIEGIYTVEVEASDKDEAKRLAEDEVPYEYNDVDTYNWDEQSSDFDTGYIEDVTADEDDDDA